MITDAKGNPIVSEGKDARHIKIVESNVDGKMQWGVEYFPTSQAFEFEEITQVLGNVIAGISQYARAMKREAILKQKLETIK